MRPPGDTEPETATTPPDDAVRAAPAGTAPPTSRVAPQAPSLSPQPLPVSIGSVGTYSGVAGEPFSHQRAAVQAWVSMTNHAGGLHGAPVRLLTADDGGDPARHQSLVRDLVERHGVIAFVGNAEALTGAASVEYLIERRVPVVGSEGSGQYFYTSPMHFPQQAHGDRWVYAALAAGASQGNEQGKHRFGIVACVEITLCQQAYDMAPAVVKDNGMHVVFRQRATFTQPDFTAECLAARSAGVEVLFAGLDPNSVIRLAASCVRQGFRPIYAVSGGVASRALLQSKDLEGIAVGSAVYPFTQADTPAMRQFHDAMRAYVSDALDINHAVGWVAAKLFERAALRLPTRPGPEDVLPGLWAIADDDLGGLTYPLTFVADRPAPQVTCWWNMTIRGGKYDVFQDTAKICR